MDANRVVEILAALEAHGVEAWIDGGWGVDALVGESTRAHGDLDLAVDRSQLEGVVKALEALGFVTDPTAEPGMPARLVMAGERGMVDLHPLVFDGTGNGWQQLDPAGRHWGRYPADDLTARGVVGGRAVRCLSAALQLRFHLGYEWGDADRHDLRLLQERFHVGPTLPDLLAPGDDRR